MYEVAELVSAARREFGQSAVLVAAALKSAGKDEYELKEAHKIVKEFAKEKVKWQERS